MTNKYLEKLAVSYTITDPYASYHNHKNLTLTSNEYKQFLNRTEDLKDKHTIKALSIGAGVGALAGGLVGAATARPGGRLVKAVVLGGLGSMTGAGLGAKHVHNKAHRTAVKELLKKELGESLSKDEIKDGFEGRHHVYRD